MSRAATIARLFCRELREELTEEQIITAAALNAAERNPDVCHLHDFTDANLTMARAFEDAGEDWNDTELWNVAWAIAKRRGFALS